MIRETFDDQYECHSFREANVIADKLNEEGFITEITKINNNLYLVNAIKKYANNNDDSNDSADTNSVG